LQFVAISASNGRGGERSLVRLGHGAVDWREYVAARESALKTTNWIAVAICLLSAQRSVAATDAAPGKCGLKQYGNVDLLVSEENPVLARITIDAKPALMVLDLSNGPSLMWADAAKRLELTRMPLMAESPMTYGNKPITDFVKIGKFMMGDVRFGAPQFLLVASPYPNLEVDGLPVVGSIGLNFFANADFELNLKARKLTLFSQDHCKGRVVYWTDSYDSVPMQRSVLGNISFPMELDGKKIDTTLTTASAGSSLYTDISRRYFGFDETSDGIVVESGAQGESVGHFKAMALTTNGLKVLNARVELYKQSPKVKCSLQQPKGVASYGGCYGMYPLRLGREVLQQLRIYVATKENVMYFSAASNMAVPAATPLPAETRAPAN
jgi:hypothetical protein